MIDKTSKPGVWIYPNGREVCQYRTCKGKDAYRVRKWLMFKRQRGLCCLCGLPMLGDDVTFDHEHGRGMAGGSRDDRIELPDGTWINGAAHEQCNGQKGSRRIPYNAARNERAA